MTNQDCFDIAIVGGGLTGLMMAIALSHATSSSADTPAIVLIDRDNNTKKLRPDLRTTTIHAAGKIMLETLGVWDNLKAVPTPITSIKVGDSAPAKTDFARRYQKGFRIDWHDPKTPMAYVVANEDLLAALSRTLESRPVQILNGADVVGITRHKGAESSGLAKIQLADRSDISCHLIVACDGANSQLRELAAMRRLMATHRQTAIVANLRVERDHDNTAFQRFLPTGPMALMPHGAHHLSLVWTLPKTEADKLHRCDDDTFSAAVYAGFGDYLGGIHLDGPRWLWPLIPAVMPELTSPQLILAGDAGHVIHPLAGQGYNLALGDAAVLADAIAAASARGLAPSHLSVRTDYETGRKTEVRAMSAITSGLNELMSFQPRLARLAGAGMHMVNASPIKRVLQKSASGGHLTDANLLKGRLPS